MRLWALTLVYSTLLLPSIAQYDAASSGYELKAPPLTTDWTDTVGTDPWQEYPRPQQVREKWQSLNGIWRYQNASSLGDVDSPPTGGGSSFGQAVMVPSCLESGLSGVMNSVGGSAFSWFQTTFNVPSDWQGQEVLINFGAVDYEATVFINGVKATNHRGGFTRFAAEIGSLVNFGADNEVLVFVFDPTDGADGTPYVVPEDSMLNGDFVFTFGTLDQGYWPDGIYTPPSYEAMVFDLKFLKELGFNMVRKHIKVETDLFYRACDEMGLLVIQDMPSLTNQGAAKLPNETQQAQFVAEMKEMVDLHKSFPSIFTWVIYNEGWGQLASGPEVQITPQLHSWDPTRLIDSVTGWHDHGAGDFSDNHHYPNPECGIPNASQPSGPYDSSRIAFQGEFGGLGNNVTIDHLWNDLAAINTIPETYEIDDTIQQWNSRSREVLAVLQSQITGFACSGAVWTQTTDVEGEVNGLMTCDRRMKRVIESQWKADIQALYAAAEARGAGTGTGSVAKSEDTTTATVFASLPSNSEASGADRGVGISAAAIAVGMVVGACMVV
ncbi:hypothetical protein IAT38_004903 [Cryptococcus sp. DSM 104549]